MITLLSATVDEILAVCTTVGGDSDGGAVVDLGARTADAHGGPAVQGELASAGLRTGDVLAVGTGPDRGRAHGLEAALGLVDDVDRAAVAAKQRPSDARRTLAGRAALRLLVAARVGAPATSAADIVVDRTCLTCGEQHGRPRVDGLSVSTSSAGDRVLVAVADAKVEVGVDVELVPDVLFEGFDDFALHPAERRSLPQGPGMILGRIGSWVEKEAVLKAAGIGLTTPLEDLLVSAAPEDRVVPSSVEMIGAWEWRPVVQTASRQLLGLSVTALPSPEGYRCAIAAREPRRIRSVPVGSLAGEHPTPPPSSTQRAAALASSSRMAAAVAAFRGLTP